MHRELDAALSPVHLSVAMPKAELLHYTIAVKLPLQICLSMYGIHG